MVGTYFLGEETVNAAGTKAKNAGYYALVDYNFTDSLGAFVRYDRLDPNTDISRNEISMILLGIDGMLFQTLRSGGRWQVEYSVKETFLGGNILTSGTTKYSDQRIFAQVTWGF